MAQNVTQFDIVIPNTLFETKICVLSKAQLTYCAMDFTGQPHLPCTAGQFGQYNEEK